MDLEDPNKTENDRLLASKATTNEDQMVSTVNELSKSTGTLTRKKFSITKVVSSNAMRPRTESDGFEASQQPPRPEIDTIAAATINRPLSDTLSDDEDDVFDSLELLRHENDRADAAAADELLQRYRESEGQDTVTSLTSNIYKRQLENIKRKKAAANQNRKIIADQVKRTFFLFFLIFFIYISLVWR